MGMRRKSNDSIYNLIKLFYVKLHENNKEKIVVQVHVIFYSLHAGSWLFCRDLCLHTFAWGCGGLHNPFVDTVFDYHWQAGTTWTGSMGLSFAVRFLSVVEHNSNARSFSRSHLLLVLGIKYNQELTSSLLEQQLLSAYTRSTATRWCIF